MDIPYLTSEGAAAIDKKKQFRKTHGESPKRCDAGIKVPRINRGVHQLVFETFERRWRQFLKDEAAAAATAAEARARDRPRLHDRYTM